VGASVGVSVDASVGVDAGVSVGGASAGVDAGVSVGNVASKPPSPREGLLLLQARQRLANDDPQGALDLVRQHERDFPKSQLAPERVKLAEEARGRGAR